MINISEKRRDFLFVVLLIVMVKTAMQRQKIETDHAIISSLSIEIPTPEITALQKFAESPQPLIAAPEKLAASDQSSNDFTEHEANKDIVSHLAIVQTHIDQLITLVKPTSTQSAQLYSMRQRLARLKKEYKNSSPAISLFGSIGTTAIVLKENEVETNILKMVNLMRTILQTLTKDPAISAPYASIAQGVKQNALLLASLAQKNVITAGI